MPSGGPGQAVSENALSLTNLRASETLKNATLAGSLASLIVWFAPPGTDFAAHVFQLHLYLQHGFALWTNSRRSSGSASSR